MIKARLLSLVLSCLVLLTGCGKATDESSNASNQPDFDALARNGSSKQQPQTSRSELIVRSGYFRDKMQTSMMSNGPTYLEVEADAQLQNNGSENVSLDMITVKYFAGTKLECTTVTTLTDDGKIQVRYSMDYGDTKVPEAKAGRTITLSSGEAMRLPLGTANSNFGAYDSATERYALVSVEYRGRVINEFKIPVVVERAKN